MRVTCTKLAEVVLIEPQIFRDGRGYFLESYHQERYLEAGIPHRFVQDNVSRSMKGVLRGLHYQIGHPQGKLVTVAEGEIYDVAVDLRKESPTFGKWAAAILSTENHRQIYIPEGFAHGFCVLSECAVVHYKCTDYYSPKEERGIRWDDPDIGISWPISDPIVSDKDCSNPLCSEVPEEDLFRYEATRSLRSGA